ncbi:MAG: hypothetical protein WA741_20710 [Candidatus Sulfotelmatobacter sp.]
MKFWSVFLIVLIMLSCSRTETTETKPSGHWDPKAAAAYLDQREVAWMGWQGAARDHGTFCVSCHTAVPYALARPALRDALAEKTPSVTEQKLLDNVTRRVRLWKEVAPFYGGEDYSGAKHNESRGTESVLNALILASYDRYNGHLSDATLAAFQNMWELQTTAGVARGAWPWLQFGMEPFEAKDSQYYGASLAAIAVGMAPDNYRSTPEIQEKLTQLSDYLNREYVNQSTMNRVALLWAAAKWPGLVEPARRQEIIKDVFAEQQADGGWRLSPLAWPKGSVVLSFIRVRWRSDGTRQHEGSDGYATAMITWALLQVGIPSEDPRLGRGLSWLAQNQNNVDGFWPSFSLTKHRVPSSNVGHFMDDAATGYAVLALSTRTHSE